MLRVPKGMGQTRPLKPSTDAAVLVFTECPLSPLLTRSTRPHSPSHFRVIHTEQARREKGHLQGRTGPVAPRVKEPHEVKPAAVPVSAMTVTNARRERRSLIRWQLADVCGLAVVRAGVPNPSIGHDCSR
jgi:hypothetical protein